MKVAIVHDWLVGGGAERVVLELHKIFPDAPIYTSYCSRQWRKKLDDKVVTGFLQYWPFSKLRKFVPVLRILWVSRLNLKEYDLVISSTGNGEAKGVKTSGKTRHLCYCNTPVHFYWRHYEKYLANPGFGLFNPLARLGLRVLVRPLRAWDLKASQRPDAIIANSSHIKDEIKSIYGRDSDVIHPPVDIDEFKPKSEATRSGYVTMSRLVPHKRIDVIVEACTQLDLPLKVIGQGPEQHRLQRLAGPTIQILTDVTDTQRAEHLASAEAFIFASYEDFGITPVEAMAAGTPVIAYQAGGALDYVVPGKTGQFFKEQSAESLVDALKAFDANSFNSKEIIKSVEEFSPEHFKKRMQACIQKVMNYE